MKLPVQKIKFKGNDFILTIPEGNDSPIATIKQYQAGECSYAHLYRKSGRVIRFGVRIGTIEDIEFGELTEIEVDTQTATAGFFYERR